MRLCPWPQTFLSLASSIPVLGLQRVCPLKGCPWPWFFLCVSLASSLVSSTPPLINTSSFFNRNSPRYLGFFVSLKFNPTLKLHDAVPLRYFGLQLHTIFSPKSSNIGQLLLSLRISAVVKKAKLFKLQ